VRGPVQGGGGGGTARVLDEGTRLGVDIGAYFYPLLSPQWGSQGEEEARCRLLDGTRDPRRVYPRAPAVLEHGRRTAEAWVERYAEFPSFRHALVNSEYQVPTCTNDEVRALAREEAGVDTDAVLRPEWFRKPLYGGNRAAGTPSAAGAVRNRQDPPGPLNCRGFGRFASRPGRVGRTVSIRQDPSRPLRGVGKGKG
jgi:hypothetical protein